MLTDGDETCGTQQAALQSASNLFFKGVYVFTVAVTTTANITLVNKIAGVGGTQKSRLVSDAAGLKKALDEIFVRLNSCECVDGCLIGGVCHAPNAMNPTNICQVCDPTQSKTAWSRSDKGCLIGGKCYADGALNPSNSCQKCDRSKSTSAWSPSGKGCWIKNTCYTANTVNPADKCQICDPTRNATGWSSNPSCCSAGSRTFSYTGSVQTFALPSGCREVVVTARGAGGGSATYTSYSVAGGANYADSTRVTVTRNIKGGGAAKDTNGSVTLSWTR